MQAPHFHEQCLELALYHLRGNDFVGLFALITELLLLPGLEFKYIQ